MTLTFADGRLAAGAGGARTIEAEVMNAPDVVGLAGGGFVALWSYRIWGRAQIFDRNGEPVGAPFDFYQSDSAAPSRVSVAARADGGFIATWDDSSLDSYGDPSQSGVLARLFDSSGAPIGEPFLVNTTTFAMQSQPTVAVLSNGNFLFAWTDQNADSNGSGIHARLFDSNGAAIGDEFLANTTETGNQYYPRLQALAGGGCVMTWGGDFDGFRFQLFDDDGQKVGSESAGYGTTGMAQALPSGGFVLVYAVGDDLFGQLFSATGVLVGSAFQVNTSTEGSLGIASIAVQPSGEFLVTWRVSELEINFLKDGDIKAQLFDATGAKIGTEFLATPTAESGQVHSSAVAFGSGDFGLLWTDYQGTTTASLLFRPLFSATHGTAGNDHMTATADPDYHFGLDGHDLLEGGAGNDNLEGGAGSDTMAGGAGNDTYVVNSLSDVVNEAPGEGSDTIETGLSYTLGAEVENLVLTGSSAVNGTGNGAANILVGNAAANRLDGLGGADTMRGGGGDDVYIVDDAGDLASETLNNGRDLVRSSVSFALGANVEKLTLTGTAAINATGNFLNNSLVGNSAANVLNGRLGADAMAGGGGDDTYMVDNLGDRVSENAGEGTDTVNSSASFSLTANIENLVLTGTGAINATGNSAANSITGNAAANLINGGGGADILAGLGGNDIYIVDHAGDVVTELADGGVDLVKSNVTFSLGAEVEKLTLRGSAAIDGTGNDLANTIAGNEAANRLDGGAGADKLMGAGGNDTYVVDDAGDQAIEASSGGGTDLVLSSVTFTLGDNVEQLTLTGADAVDGTGNDLANALTGNGAANVLDGGRGNDTLLGGGGDDTLRGGLGNDTLQGDAGADDFLFHKPLGATNIDTILDFAAGSDDIVLENAVFAGIAAGALNPNALAIGAAAGDVDDRIVYDPATGNLYYDADGNGSAAQVLFATLDNAPATLSASDFSVI